MTTNPLVLEYETRLGRHVSVARDARKLLITCLHEAGHWVGCLFACLRQHRSYIFWYDIMECVRKLEHRVAGTGVAAKAAGARGDPKVRLDAARSGSSPSRIFASPAAGLKMKQPLLASNSAGECREWSSADGQCRQTSASAHRGHRWTDAV